MAKQTAKRKVNGVLGPIDADELGFTLMHEHILIANWSMRQSFADWLDLDAHAERATGEVRSARALGVKTIVDLTPINLGRDIHVIREVAERAEAQVIAATGFYYHEEPWMAGWEADRLVEFLLRDIERGIQGTDSKAGIIKAATAEAGVTRANKKTLQVAARLQKASGVPISTHTTPANRSGLAQQDVFEEEGVDLSRVVIGHCGDTADLDYLETVLRRGSSIGMDRFGLDMILPMKERVVTIAELCRRGWAERMVLSHDACCHIDFFPPGLPMPPKWNYRHICEDVIPALREEGVPEAQIRAMTVDNPRRLLAGA
jgi:phosphotriesterase-related protein